MSFYSDASLVLIPSGYKDQKIYSAKPTDGSGDLVFSRASNATRVASNGLIEKVRTNLVLQSNQFDTTWTTSSATVTSGQAGYDGTNNAWELNSSSSGGGILQSNTQGGLQTFSVYAKGSVSTGIRLYAFGSVNAFAYFNLNTGALGSVPSGVSAKIEAVGGGWYRCSMTFDQTNTTLRFYTTDNNNSNAAGVVYIQDAQLEVGDIATDYIATTTAAVSVGPVSGLPRLDYLNSSCPRLLLEPQRTNLALWSENFDNAAWTKIQSSITANSVTSPDGYTNADTFIADGTLNEHQIRSTGVISLTSGTTYTTSIFAKAGTNNFVQIVGSGTPYLSTVYANFDIANGVVGNVGAGTTASIQNYGNGWYRCLMTATAQATTSTNTFLVNIVASNTAARGEVNALNTNVYVWGAQCEAGAYATSYIPTLGTSVTRVADDCVKTSATSIIGQTEGVAFIDFDFTGNYSSGGIIPISLDGGSTSEIYFWVQTNGTARFDVNNTTQQASITGSIGAVGRKKVAIAYKQNDFALYINGVQIGTDTNGTVPATNRLYVGRYYANTSYNMTSGVNQFLLFPTRLTNAQLAELTTL